MKRLLDSYRFTRMGGVVVFLFFAALLVLLVGPHHDRVPALIVILITLAIAVASGLGRAGGRRTGGG